MDSPLRGRRRRRELHGPGRQSASREGWPRAQGRRRFSSTDPALARGADRVVAHVTLGRRRRHFRNRVRLSHNSRRAHQIRFKGGVRNGHLVRHVRRVRRPVVAHDCPGVYFRERAAAFPRWLCATASRDCERATCSSHTRLRWNSRRLRARDRLPRGSRIRREGAPLGRHRASRRECRNHGAGAFARGQWRSIDACRPTTWPGRGPAQWAEWGRRRSRPNPF
jgi:hypothetical protein